MYASIELPPVVCSISDARGAPAGGDDQVVGCESMRIVNQFVFRGIAHGFCEFQSKLFSLSLSSLTPMRFSLCALHTHDNNPLKR